MGEALEIIGLLNQMYHFWFDNQSTLYLSHLNAGGPLQLYIAWVFRKNTLSVEMTPK